MKQVDQVKKVENLIRIVKKEMEVGFIPIFDRYTISAKELALLYGEDPENVYRALESMKESVSKIEFETELRKSIKLSKKEWKKWEIFIPYDLRELKRNFKFEKSEYILISKKKLLTKIKEKNPSKRFHKALENYNGRFLWLQIYAKNHLHALDMMENEFYLLRGMIEFADNVYMTKTSTNLVNLVSLTHPKYVFYMSDNQCEHIEYYVPPCSANSYSLTLGENGRNNLNLIQNTLKKLKEKDYDIYSVLESIFRMYAYALEEEYSHNRFLRFWQIAELLGGTGNEGRKDKVEKILTFFMKLSNKFKNANCDLVLADFLKKRTLLVHEGINKITHSDDSNLKILIDVGIHWLIDFCTKIKTKKNLEEFNKLQFQYQSKDINITKQIIEFVK